MTTYTIQNRIARAIELKQIIATLDAELKQIKADLIEAAENRAEEHTPTEGGGWSWRYLDAEDNLVCVTQPAPKLKGTIHLDSANFARIKEVAGRTWSLLFYQVAAFKPVDDFRDKAIAHLGRDARKLIKLVTSESALQVSFEVSQTEAA
jgi:hypothetical protein